MQDSEISPLHRQFVDYQDACSHSLAEAFRPPNDRRIGESSLFISDLNQWRMCTCVGREEVLYAAAVHEYELAILNMTQSQYRNAFKSLRLVLELVIQGCYLSTHLIELNEWLGNARDTNWSLLLDPEKGPFSSRFADAFFPALRERTPIYSGMARALYRELSETTHGNVPNLIPLATHLGFDFDTFNLWHEKAESARTIMTFCLTVRYLQLLTDAEKLAIEQSVLKHLGHLEPIRASFGGAS